MENSNFIHLVFNTRLKKPKFMKLPLFFLIVLFPCGNRAQTKPQFKKATTKHSNLIIVEPNRGIEKIVAGDTCYVIINSLPLLGKPVANSSAATYLMRNAKVVVREVLPTRWLLVDYYNLDVSVDGYVLRQCVSLKKAH